MADSLLDLLTPQAGGAFGGTGKMNMPMARMGAAMMQPGALNPMALAQAANPQQKQCQPQQQPLPGVQEQPPQSPALSAPQYSPYSMMIGRQAY